MNPNDIKDLQGKIAALCEAITRDVCASNQMTQEQTETIVAICYAESGMNPRAIHHNNNGSTDYGINQINNRFWIGEGKAFPDPEYIMDNPDKAINWMCQQVRTNPLGFRLWSTYLNGSFLRYMKKKN